MGRSNLARSNTNNIALDLNETVVQTLFNNCLSNSNTKNQSRTILFSVAYGYKPEDEILIAFDKDALEKNKKAIEYLYGQLKDVHNGNNVKSTHALSVEDFSTTYTGNSWTHDKGALLKFLYLGCTEETLLIKPFSKKLNGTDISSKIKPTLSPKDPNFPAWWEEHKSEWEDRKKGGQEPADD